jgi:peptidoglycan/LPS O-acetylase OafA/YrhL
LGESWQSNPLTYLYLSIYPVIAWSWIMMLVGYAKKYLTRPHRIHSYVNQAIYPYYILHQTIIVILAFYVVKVEESILAKYIFILSFTLVLCMFIYHLFIRPYNAMRILFGMKPKKKTKTEALTDKLIAQMPVSPAVKLL